MTIVRHPFFLFIILLAFGACKPDTNASNQKSRTVEVKKNSPAVAEKKDSKTQEGVKKSTIAASQQKPTNKKSNVATSKKIKKKSVSKKPRRVAMIKFDKTMYDFGEITEGDIVTFTYTFTNIGNAPLSIVGADPSCGCAQPEIPFLDIMPGDQNKITVKYNSVNKSGIQHPEVIIQTNGKPKYIALKLKGVVLPKEKGNTRYDTITPKAIKDTIN